MIIHTLWQKKLKATFHLKLHVSATLLYLPKFIRQCLLFLFSLIRSNLYVYCSFLSIHVFILPQKTLFLINIPGKYPNLTIQWLT